MKKTLLLLLTLSMFFSCQKEESPLLKPTDALAQEKMAFVQTQNVNPDPSILNSKWWKDMHPAKRLFLSVELSRDNDPITMTELQNRIKQISQSSNTRAKTCPGYPAANPAGDVVLNSQADVVAFGAQKCKKITGVLEIIDTLGPDPICDLTPLKGIKEVGSSLSISSDCLTSLDGLEKIKSVGKLGPFGFVGVIGANLVDISALSKLSTVTGSINIINCDLLTSVSGAFSKITTIQSGKTSAPLTSLYVLNIDDNASLTDLGAFGNLTQIEGGLRILSNGSLADLDDFSGLNDIGEDIFIFDNAALQNVNELSNITAISDDLFVLDNPSLTECCGFFNLLCNNPPSCSISGVGDNAVIFNNGAGCTDIDIIANGPCL